MSIWEEAIEEWILVSVETGRAPIVKVFDLIVVVQHSDCDFFECAPFINLQELGQLLVYTEPDFAACINVCNFQNSFLRSLNGWFRLNAENFLEIVSLWNFVRRENTLRLYFLLMSLNCESMLDCNTFIVATFWIRTLVWKLNSTLSLFRDRFRVYNYLWRIIFRFLAIGFLTLL